MATERQHAPAQWSLESLNKAYQQGYMAGLTGQARNRQPHAEEIPAAGWDDGAERLSWQQHSA